MTVVADPLAVATEAEAPAAGHAAPKGTPWTLLLLAGFALILAGALGLHNASLAIVVFLTGLFLIFLLRHLSFAVSALSTAQDDMKSRTGFDFGYEPFISVMVPCNNEELVIEGLVNTLLLFDYPKDRHELIIIDDGSDDDTGVIVDELARRHPVLRWCLIPTPVE